MGYTHYWKHGPLDDAARKGWEAAMSAIRDILHRHKEILCLEYDRPSEPPLLDQKNFTVKFNGKGKDGHETFVVSLSRPGKDFCKTTRKPYDLPVCEVLLVLLWNVPGFSVSSDGSEKAGLESWDENWPEAAKEVLERYSVRIVAEAPQYLLSPSPWPEEASTSGGHPRNAGASDRHPRNAGAAAAARWKCPRCGGQKIRIAVLTWAELIQQGDGEVETDTGSEALNGKGGHDHDWDEESPAACLGCGMAGKVITFDTVYERIRKKRKV